MSADGKLDQWGIVMILCEIELESDSEVLNNRFNWSCFSLIERDLCPWLNKFSSNGLLDLKEFTDLTKWSWLTNERIRSKWQEDKVAGEQRGGAASLLSYFTADCDQRLLITACNIERSWSIRQEALCPVCDTKISLLTVLQGSAW